MSVITENDTQLKQNLIYIIMLLQRWQNEITQGIDQLIEYNKKEALTEDNFDDIQDIISQLCSNMRNRIQQMEDKVAEMGDLFLEENEEENDPFNNCSFIINVYRNCDFSDLYFIEQDKCPIYRKIRVENVNVNDAMDIQVRLIEAIQKFANAVGLNCTYIENLFVDNHSTIHQQIIDEGVCYLVDKNNLLVYGINLLL